MGVDLVLRVFRWLYMQAIDQAWVDHLQNMEHLRDGIGLRGYGQRDPKNEYKKEGFTLFLNMMANVSSKVVERLFSTEVKGQEQIAEARTRGRREAARRAGSSRGAARQRCHGRGGTCFAPPAAPTDLDQARQAAQSKPTKREEPKVGRNDLCPCGSGKKFKQCHGAAAAEEELPGVMSQPVRETQLPPRFTRLQLGLRILALIALGVIGVSTGGFYCVLYFGLPILAAVRIAMLGTSQAYAETDGPILLG